MERVADFPLFPLGLVALPSELIPLHIFEERYKTMFARCLSEPCEFGILWIADDGLRSTGCACEVAQVVNRAEDGRIDLIARGTRPFAVERRQEELAYPAGTVVFLDDDDELPDPEAQLAAHSAYLELVQEATEREPDPGQIALMSSYDMAATVELGPEVKQQLLEARSEAARLAQVARVFRAAVKRLDYMERAKVRARSNGKVVFS